VWRTLLDGFDRVEGLAVRVEADGRAVTELLAGAWLPALGRCEAGCGLEAAVVGWWWCSAGAICGLNVATESIAPATRQTARMLASRGMTVPCPANGEVSRRSRLRRLLARSSRW
jgi:hypothetical protein